MFAAPPGMLALQHLENLDPVQNPEGFLSDHPIQLLAVFTIIWFVGEFHRLKVLFMIFLTKHRLEWLPSSTVTAYMVLYASMSILTSTLVAFFLVAMDTIMTLTQEPHCLSTASMLFWEFSIGCWAQLVSMLVLKRLLLMVAWYMDGEKPEDIMHGKSYPVQDVELGDGRYGVDKERERVLASAAGVLEMRKAMQEKAKKWLAC